MLIVPFKISDVHWGFSEVEGNLSVEDGLIVLDFELKVLGLIEQSSEVVKVEPAVLAHVELKTGWFTDELILRPKRRRLLSVIPGEHKEGLIILKVKRKYRSALHRMLGRIELLVDQAVEKPSA